MSGPIEPRDLRPPVEPAVERGVAAEENLLRHYVGVIRRRYRWIVLAILVGFLGGLVSTIFFKSSAPTDTYYKATNSLVINGVATSDLTQQSQQNNTFLLQQALLIVQSKPLLDHVARKTHLSSSNVSMHLNGSLNPDNSALDITAIWPDPSMAKLISDTAAAYIDKAAVQATKDQYTSQRNLAEMQLTQIQKSIDDTKKQIASTTGNDEILQRQLATYVDSYQKAFNSYNALGAQAPSYSMSVLQNAMPIQINTKGYTYRLSYNLNSRGSLPSSQLNTSSGLPDGFNETDLTTATPLSSGTRVMLGLLAGLFLGVFSAFVVEAWDDRIRRRDRAEVVTGLPVLAELPRFSRNQAKASSIAVIDLPQTALAERFRAARTSVLFAVEATLGTPGMLAGGDSGARPPAPVVMVTSPTPGDGKSTTVANLAAAYAENGMRTLIVDGDFRRSGVTRFLAPVPNLISPDGPSTTRIDDVYFLSAPRGLDTPSEVVFQLRTLIAKWRDEFDIVLLDTPPTLSTNDATDMLAAADAVVLVLRAGQTRSGPAERASDVLQRYRATVLGVILNGCDHSELTAYYGSAYGRGYGYGYGYGYGRLSAPILPNGNGNAPRRPDPSEMPPASPYQKPQANPVGEGSHT